VIEIPDGIHSKKVAKPFFYPQPTTTVRDSRRMAKSRVRFAALRRHGDLDMRCRGLFRSPAIDVSESGEWDARWSPDGKRIVFYSRPHKHSQILMINAEGGKPVALTDGTAEDKVPSCRRMEGSSTFVES